MPLVPPHLLTDGFPTFSAAEMRRRRTALLEAAAGHGLERVLLVGMERSGTAIPWVTGWPVTREAWAVVEDGRRDALFVGFYNHVPQARELARACDVEGVGPSAVATVVAELDRRGGRGRIGVAGPLPAGAYRGLQAAGVEVVDLGADYVRLRQRKSAEELEWLRVGAALSDAGIEALRTGLRSGLTEWELGGPRRAGVRAARRHHAHPLLRGHVDAGPTTGQPGPARLRAPGGGR